MCCHCALPSEQILSASLCLWRRRSCCKVRGSSWDSRRHYPARLLESQDDVCPQVQIVGNHEGCILDLCADWQGATADANIWNASPVKFIIDCQCHYLMAGDSGYPFSETCITPYRVAEAAGDPSKRLFNRKHSGLRMLCTECILGPWKRRWRCLKLLPTKYAWAQETVIACGILHTASSGLMQFRMMRWQAPKPVVPLEDLEPAMVGARGQNLQDNLRLTMRCLLVKITWQVTMLGPDPEAENATFLYDCVTACMPISLPMCQPACLLLCLCVSLHAHFHACVSACLPDCMPSCIPVPNFLKFRAFYSVC
jgi:hypothetical protein